MRLLFLATGSATAATTMTLIKKQNVRTLALIGCTLTYLLVGAAVFDSLESDFEQAEATRLLAEELDLCTKYNITFQDFQLISRNVILSAPHKAGIQWKFSGAIYFATTVITTIGYGHSTPQTAGGKVFCMVYALVGIPLNLVMFQSIGERLNVFTTFLLEHLIRAVRRRCHPSGSDVAANSAASDVTTPIIGTTHLIIVSMNVSTLVVAGGAWAFSTFEGWSFLDSVYYCVITLTTVGFGDMVALQQHKALQNRPDLVVFSIVFILFGLAVVSAAMNLLVLRFLTMNTEDERRDEELRALQAALHHQQDTDALDDVTIVVSSSALTDSSVGTPTSVSNGKLRDGRIVEKDNLAGQNGTTVVSHHRKQQSTLSTWWRPCKGGSSPTGIGRKRSGLCCLPHRYTAAPASSESQPPSPIWQGRQRYHVTRPPSASITRLLPAPQTMRSPEDWPHVIPSSAENRCPIHGSSSTGDTPRVARCAVIDFSGSATSSWKFDNIAVQSTVNREPSRMRRRLSL